MSNNHTNIKKIFETKKLVFQPFSKSTQNEYLFKFEKPKNQQCKGKLELIYDIRTQVSPGCQRHDK